MKSKTPDSGSLPRTEAALDHVTKGRVRGPQGRRLPRKPQRPNNGLQDSKIDSVVDSEDDTSVSPVQLKDSRGRATSLSALEASSENHSKIRLEFELGSEDSSSSSANNSGYLSNTPPYPNQSPNTNRLSFEQAWFITLPDSHRKSGRSHKLEQDEDSTSDYSSMHEHGSPPSTKSSKRSSPTNPPARNSLRNRIEKFLCSLL